MFKDLKLKAKQQFYVYKKEYIVLSLFLVYFLVFFHFFVPDDFFMKLVFLAFLIGYYIAYRNSIYMSLKDLKNPIFSFFNEKLFIKTCGCFFIKWSYGV